MTRLSAVPGWVCHPLRAVSDIEHFLLRLYGRTQSPEALGGFSSLNWLGGEDGAATVGPLAWRAPPLVEFAEAFLAVADALAEGEPYPPPTWWGEHADCIGPMTAGQWSERAGLWPERHFAHGVVCALGWALGVFDDPAIMAPLHRGDGGSVSYGEREEWRVRLRGFAIPPQLDGDQLQAWLQTGPTARTAPARPAPASRGVHRGPAGW